MSASPSSPDAAHPRFLQKPILNLGGLRIALVQLAVGMDKKKNIEAAVEQIHKAKYNGAQLVALPEFFNAPYGTKYFNEYAESVPDGESSRALRRAAIDAGVCVVGGTLPERSGDDLYNTCTVWDNCGNLIAQHRKVHLFDIDIPGKITFKESDVLSAGDHITTFEYLGVKIGLGICYDLRFFEMAQVMSKEEGGDRLPIPLVQDHSLNQGPAREVAATSSSLQNTTVPRPRGVRLRRKLQHFFRAIHTMVTPRRFFPPKTTQESPETTLSGCSVLIYPGAFNMTTGPRHWELLGRARANDLQLWVALVSPARDTEADYVAWGHTMLIDPWGSVVNELDEKPGLLCADIDLRMVEEVRSQIPVRSQRRTDIYDTISHHDDES